MPYGPNDKLPSNVATMDAKSQRQWRHIFNSCHSDGGDDSKCFAMANGVVKRNKGLDLTADELVAVEACKYSDYEDYASYDRRLSKDQAQYDPMGATDGKGCANCQWFQSPSSCAVVAGTISPTGLSSLWRALEPVQVTPIPVTVVVDNYADKIETKAAGSSGTLAGEDRASLLERATSALKSAFGFSAPVEEASPVTPPVLSKPFTLVKQKDGQLRFFTAWSNNFMDREGEIFSEDAHKDFIDWCETGGQYPELWQWHTEGTKYGQVDWLDYTDGFVFASGTIDKGYEPLAEQIAKEDTGVSHGFSGLQSGNVIVSYRSYELSTLPRSNAAVWTTSFDIARQGAKEMGFTAARKQYLKDHGLSDEQITQAETKAVGMKNALVTAGIAWKDADLEPDPAPVVTEPPAAAGGDKAAPAPAPATPNISEQLLEMMNKQTDALVALAGQMKSVSEKVDAVDGRVKSIESDTDGRVARAITPSNRTAVVAASKADDNVVAQEQRNDDQEFFGQIVAGLSSNYGSR